MTTWITDDNGNRASVEYFGTRAKAEAALATLLDCSDCTNCSRCTDCRGCDLSLPNHRVPVSDPRGYTWLAIAEDGAWRIRAGCRSFSLVEARAHWLAPDYAGPASVRETVGFALDWIEAKPVPEPKP